MRLVETYLALGVRGEAERSAAVLGANYPGSDWYNRAYKLMREYPVEPIPAIQPGQPVVPTGTPGSTNIGSPGGGNTATPSAAAPGVPRRPATTVRRRAEFAILSLDRGEG